MDGAVVDVRAQLDLLPLPCVPAAAPLSLTEDHADWKQWPDWKQCARTFVEQIGPGVALTREMVEEFVHGMPKEVSERLYDVGVDELVGVQTMVIIFGLPDGWSTVGTVCRPPLRTPRI